MTSPFIPSSFSYSDAPQGGSVMPMIIAPRNPSNSIDKNYAAGYFWLSSLDMRDAAGNTGSGNMYYQGGNTAGVPNWTLVSNSGGVLNTLSDGSITVNPSGGNIALVSTSNQVMVTSSAPAHELIFSIPSVFIAPGSIASTSTLTSGTSLTVGTDATIGDDLIVTDDASIGGDLTVTGTITFGGLAVNGTVAINTSGSGTTTIGNAAAGAITIDVGTGDFQVNGGGNEIHIGDDAAANILVLGSNIGAAQTHVQAGTGDLLLDGADTAEIILGSATQTGLITMGRSTVGEDINIGSAINVGAQTISIANGASGANSTVNILSGTGTSGAGVLALGSNPRVTTIGIGNVAPSAARVTTISGGNQAQNDTVTVLGGAPSANSQIFNLLSGAASGGTQTINMFSGNSAAATQTYNLFTGSGAGAINIGTGTTGVKTIAIGGTAANVITLGNTQTTGSVAIGNAMTSGTVTVGGTAGTGTITLGQATNATGQTVSISSGASIAGANIVNVLAGATPAASQTLNIMTGLGSAGTYTFNLLTANSTGTTQAVNIATGSAVSTIAIGGTGANTIAIANTQTGGSLSLAHAMTTGNIVIGDAQTTGTLTIGSTAAGSGLVRIVDGTGAQTVQIATGAGAKTVSLGSTNTTSTTTIQAGSGGVNLTGDVNLTAVATKISLNGGAVTDFIGTGVLALGTVTIANTNISASDRIFLSRTAVNASTTLGELTYVINASTNFIVTSVIVGTPGSPQTGDLSSFSYIIFRQT